MVKSKGIRIFSDAHKKALSEALKGKKKPWVSANLKGKSKDPIWGINHSKTLKGRKYTLEHRLAISNGQKKAVEEGRHLWKVNDYEHKDQQRHKIEYRIWREKLLLIAGNKCQICQSTHRLHAHHKKCYYEFPELRMDVENGEILCQSCHSKFHRKLQLEERAKHV